MFLFFKKNKYIIVLAYCAAFIGMCGHASSEFFVKLSGVSGIEVTVWRFGIGGFDLYQNNNPLTEHLYQMKDQDDQ